MKGAFQRSNLPALLILDPLRILGISCPERLPAEVHFIKWRLVPIPITLSKAQHTGMYNQCVRLCKKTKTLWIKVELGFIWTTCLCVFPCTANIVAQIYPHSSVSMSWFCRLADHNHEHQELSGRTECSHDLSK